MIQLLKRSKQTDDDFATARAAWLAIDTPFQEKVRRVESLKAAISLVRGRHEESADPRFNYARKIAGAEAIAFARDEEDRALDEITKLEKELRSDVKARIAAAEAWALAKRRETSRIAISLQPKHRAAVKSMVAAIEDLSKAMEAAQRTPSRPILAAPPRHARRFKFRRVRLGARDS